MARTRQSGRAIEAVAVVVGGAAQQHPRGSHPGQGRELVDGGDQEAGQTPVDLFIHRHQRQGCLLCEGTGAHVGEIAFAEAVLLGGVRHRAAVDLQPIGGTLG